MAAPTGRVSGSVIGTWFAARLAVLGASRPPQSPVVVTLGAHAKTVLRATNDETLVAEYALLAARDDSSRRATAISLLSAAVALRTLAQSEPWFAGDPAPTPGDITAEFGVASVTFGRDVPARVAPVLSARVA